jgi:sigma-B regulation protein RsbU (phosphoserine phosphatase)
LAAPDLYTDQVRALLRRDSLSLFLGPVFIAIGCSAAALYRLRARSKDPALLWFAVFAALYGVRLLAFAQTVRLMLDIPHHALVYMGAAITYTLPVVIALFLREVVPSRRPIYFWTSRALAVFAVVGILSDLLHREPESLRVWNNSLILASVAALLATGLRGKLDPGSRAVQPGLFAFGFFVLLENLRGLGFLPFSINLEPIGLSLFLAALGRVVAMRAFESQQRLMAIDKELEIARRIQLSILPHEFPRTANLRIAARYLPMTAVAGDFYDFLVIDERHLGILVADVSGHGVPAALIASMVKVAIATQLPHAADPALVLTGLNKMLCGKLQGQFVTAAYMFLDLELGIMRYGAAGHPPLLHWRAAERDVVEILENGLVLGLISKSVYASVERPIEQGDRFLLYTDGLTEASNEAGEFSGDDPVRARLAASALHDPDQCVTALLDDLGRWAGYDRGRAQDDDLTLVVVDVGGCQTQP